MALLTTVFACCMSCMIEQASCGWSRRRWFGPAAAHHQLGRPTRPVTVRRSRPNRCGAPRGSAPSVDRICVRARLPWRIHTRRRIHALRRCGRWRDSPHTGGRVASAGQQSDPHEIRQQKDASKLVTEVPRWMQPASLPRQIGKKDQAASPRPAPRCSRALCRRVCDLAPSVPTRSARLTWTPAAEVNGTRWT